MAGMQVLAGMKANIEKMVAEVQSVQKGMSASTSAAALGKWQELRHIVVF